MSQSEESSLQQRLEAVERSLGHIKAILCAIAVMLAAAICLPAHLSKLIGSTVLLVGTCGFLLYVFLLLFDMLLRRKLGSDSEREAQLEKELLELTKERRKEA